MTIAGVGSALSLLCKDNVPCTPTGGTEGWKLETGSTSRSECRELRYTYCSASLAMTMVRIEGILSAVCHSEGAQRLNESGGKREVVIQRSVATKNLVVWWASPHGIPTKRQTESVL